MNIHEKIELLRECGFEAPESLRRGFRDFIPTDNDDLVLYADALVDWMRERGFTFLLNCNERNGEWWAEFADDERIYADGLEYRPTRPEAIIDAALVAEYGRRERA